MNDRAICPNAAFPDLTDPAARRRRARTIRTLRASLNTAGRRVRRGGPDETLRGSSPTSSAGARDGRICGQGARRADRRGPAAHAAWGASAGRTSTRACSRSRRDAYLNEMGITSVLRRRGAPLCDAVQDPDDETGRRRAGRRRPLRALHARDEGAAARRVAGRERDAAARLASCSTRSAARPATCARSTTAPAGTVINGGTFTVSAALGRQGRSTPSATSCCTTSAPATAS